MKPRKNPPPSEKKTSEQKNEAALPPASRPDVKHERFLLALVLLAGLLIRAEYLRESVHGPGFTQPVLDPRFHDYWARALVSGDWTPPPDMPDPKIPTTPYGRPPLYPHLLALIYRVSGSYMAPRLVQMATGLASVLLLFLLARRLMGAVIALIAAALMATYWGFVYFEGELESPVFEVFVLLLLTHAAAAWARAPRLWKALLLGALLGGFVLLRPNALACAVVVAGWLAVVMGRRGQLRRGLVAAGVASLGTLVVVAPATVRNYLVSGEFFVTTYNGGVNLYVGNNPVTDCVHPIVPDVRIWTCFHYPMIMQTIAARLGKPSITFHEADNYFRQKAWAYIEAHPAITLGRIIKRAVLFWHPLEITSNQVAYYAKRFSPVLRFLPGFALFLGLAIAGLARLGLDLTRKERRESPSPDTATVVVFVLAFSFVYYATFLPFIVSGRFRVALTPFLMLFGAYGLWRIGGEVREKAYRSAGAWVAATCVAIGVAHVPFVKYVPELDFYHYYRGCAFERLGDVNHALDEYKLASEVKGGAKAQWLCALAATYQRLGKLDEAQKYFEAGLQVDPSDAMLNNDLALLLAGKKRFDQAMPHYERALRSDPDDAEIRANYAASLISLALDRVKQGQADQAVQAYEKALRVSPANRDALYNLAVVKEAQGKADEAIQYYSRCLEIEKSDAEAADRLGALLNRQGETMRAVTVFKTAIDAGAKSAPLFTDTGNALAAQGKWEEAIRQYQAAVAMQPDHAIGWHNMAKAHEKLGQIDLASACYEKALDATLDNPRQALNVVRALRRLGKKDAALAKIRVQIEAKPNAPGLKELLDEASKE